MTPFRRHALTILALGLTFMPRALVAQEMVNPEALTSLTRFIRWGGVVTSLFVIAVTWLAVRLLHNAVEGLSKRFAARRMTYQKIATILQFILYMGAGTSTILLSFQLDDRVLAIVGGTIAVSVGFAMKDLVASVFAAVTIMLDRPFQVGDRVSFGGQYGDITAIGLRSVRLQTLDDNTVTIPNNKFLSDVTSCGNYGALDMMVVMDFHIGLDQDVSAAREIVFQAAITSRYVFLPKPVTVLVTQVIHEQYPALRLRLKAYVLDTKFEKALETDINLRVLSHFREEGIRPPEILHRMSHAK
jgi:small-conductance mechanosensitive channel